MVGVVALGLALAALGVARPTAVGAAHFDCTLSSGAPVPYAGIMVIASGSVDCATTKNVMRTLVVLTRDGSFLESSDRTCHKAATCPTYMILNDPPGDQVYCSQVSGRVGPHSLAEPARCETDPTL
jgi:hypothetical protein